MIPKMPVLGLDPRMDAGFRKRSCSTKMPERQSIQYEAIALWRVMSSANPSFPFADHALSPGAAV
jgi:hypothetical protein